MIPTKRSCFFFLISCKKNLLGHNYTIQEGVLFSADNCIFEIQSSKGNVKIWDEFSSNHSNLGFINLVLNILIFAYSLKVVFILEELLLIPVSHPRIQMSIFFQLTGFPFFKNFKLLLMKFLNLMKVTLVWIMDANRGLSRCLMWRL